MTNVKDMMNKFSFAQMTSNETGKTSGSGTVGIACAFAGILGFLYGTIDYSFMSKDPAIMTQSIIVITIGAGLLGYRKSKDSKPVAAETTDETLNETEPKI
jgi:hypothetical protein